MTEPQQGTAVWKKSTASGGAGCIEVARVGETSFVRDSKNCSGSVLMFPNLEWELFLHGARSGEFKI